MAGIAAELPHRRGAKAPPPHPGRAECHHAPGDRRGTASIERTARGFALVQCPKGGACAPVSGSGDNIVELRASEGGRAHAEAAVNEVLPRALSAAGICVL